jgi:hypothetical protein
LSVKNVIIGPVFTGAETLVKAAIFIGFCKKPWRIHEVLA